MKSTRFLFSNLPPQTSLCSWLRNRCETSRAFVSLLSVEKMTRRVGVNRLLVGHRQVSTTPLATVTPPPPPTSNNNTQANSSKSSANSSNNTSSSSGGGGRRPARKAVLTLVNSQLVHGHSNLTYNFIKHT